MANIKYKKEEVITNLIKLTKELGHEPNAFEIDVCTYLPSSRQIQRRFNGLQTLRKHAGLIHTNHCAGEKRREVAKNALTRASNYEAEAINKLFLKYHDSDKFTKTVTRHFAYQQWLPDKKHYINIACDVALTDRVKKHVILIDFFYPQDMRSFDGCVRSKIRKLEKHPVSLFNCTHDVVFVCMNPEIDQITINENKIKEMKVLSMSTFQELFY